MKPPRTSLHNCPKCGSANTVSYTVSRLPKGGVSVHVSTCSSCKQVIEPEELWPEEPPKKTSPPRYSPAHIKTILGACSKDHDLRTINLLWDEFSASYALYDAYQVRKIMDAFLCCLTPTEK